MTHPCPHSLVSPTYILPLSNIAITKSVEKTAAKSPINQSLATILPPTITTDDLLPPLSQKAYPTADPSPCRRSVDLKMEIL